MCGGGYSSSALGVRARKILAEKGITEDEIVTLDATVFMNKPETELDYDVVLVAPQIRHFMTKLKAAHPNCIYEICDMRSYGMMDAEAIIKQAKDVYQKAKS